MHKTPPFFDSISDFLGLGMRREGGSLGLDLQLQTIFDPTAPAVTLMANTHVDDLEALAIQGTLEKPLEG